MNSRMSSQNIPFNIPFLSGQENEKFRDLLQRGKFSGDGFFTKECHALLSQRLENRRTLLTTSCTHALEMSAILCGIKEGDEVIMPSFTFVSTANAFVLRGAKIRFIDVRPDTMNMDEKLIEPAITKKTKAIVPVHYGGINCEMDFICSLADSYQLKVIEDAAQSLGSLYRGRPSGTHSAFSCFSFHETKNLHCGEGGALSLSDEEDGLAAEIIREKGTNRAQFIRGQVDKYTWQNVGSSYLPSELNAAFLIAQLPLAEQVTEKRRALWDRYNRNFSDLERRGIIEKARIPEHCRSNGHIFWLKARSSDERNTLIDFLKEKGVQSAFHYIPLHSAPAGQKFGEWVGTDRYTTKDSGRLMRLPMYYDLTEDQVDRISELVNSFFRL